VCLFVIVCSLHKYGVLSREVITVNKRVFNRPFGHWTKPHKEQYLACIQGFRGFVDPIQTGKVSNKLDRQHYTIEFVGFFAGEDKTILLRPFFYRLISGLGDEVKRWERIAMCRPMLYTIRQAYLVPFELSLDLRGAHVPGILEAIRNRSVVLLFVYINSDLEIYNGSFSAFHLLFHRVSLLLHLGQLTVHRSQLVLHSAPLEYTHTDGAQTKEGNSPCEPCHPTIRRIDSIFEALYLAILGLGTYGLCCCGGWVISDLAGRLKNRVQISSDALNAYVGAVEQAFGANVDFAQIVKAYVYDVSEERAYSAPEIVITEKRSVTGRPDMHRASTSYVERLNGTTRLHMRRLTRLTYAFSKKLENFEAAVGLHFACYNLVKRHNTLRATPAMAAGIERDFWTVKELVEAAA
jgi:hypothetical protein